MSYFKIRLFSSGSDPASSSVIPSEATSMNVCDVEGDTAKQFAMKAVPLKH